MEIAGRVGITAGLTAGRQQDGESAYRHPPVQPLPDADLRAPRALVVRRCQSTAMCSQNKTHLDSVSTAMLHRIRACPDWLNPSWNT